MASEDSASIRIDKFNGENFHLWKFKMQMVLEEKDLWGIVSGDEKEPVGTSIISQISLLSKSCIPLSQR